MNGAKEETAMVFYDQRYLVGVLADDIREDLDLPLPELRWNIEELAGSPAIATARQEMRRHGLALRTKYRAAHCCDVLLE